MAIRFASVMLFVSLGCAVRSAANDQLPVFQSDIQPLLVSKCGKCHSRKVQKGGLDLSSLRGIHLGGESGEALLSEPTDDSLLWTVIDDGEMPPEGEPALSADELELLRHWIASGAASKDVLAASGQQVTEHDVVPIILLRCTTCHGPQRQDGDLDLRSRTGMLTGGKRGPALVPGDPDASLMIQRIESEACPPANLLLKFFVRRPPSSEVDVLRRWIAAGAPEADIPPAATTPPHDPLVSELDRQHWAFQPPKRPSSAASIDDFIDDKLQQVGLTFSSPADRDTLIRRAYFDLIGMPPGFPEWQRWSQSDDPLWYEKMIDHLLASPHYGERWGRYWLDLAGYADSEGGISADPIRPVAWKYRDYVIAAFNQDKPYDQFLIEQIAGDELIDYENAAVINDQIVQNLIATGFLRMGIDETGSRTMNFVPERLKVISDAITVVSSGLMGLTMECARCHSHKYDPIPQRDYYRLKAIFQGALDEHDWRSFKSRTLNIGTSQHRQRIAEVNPPLEAEIKKLAARQKQLAADVQLALLRHHYPDQSDADNRATLTALKKADNNRTLPQKILVERLQRADVMPDQAQPDSVLQARQDIEAIDREIQRLRRKLVPPLTIRALWDSGRPSPTYVLRRGEHDKPGPWVTPGVPSALTDGASLLDVRPPFPNGSQKTGRRLAFARWLTDPGNPLTARVMVNRIWYHHFGTGLVKDLENFGVKGEPPSHPQLLDWLALEFIDRGWSIKEMHRLIMTSRTYRQTSQIDEQRKRLDSQNRLLSRAPLRRLDAEALRDSLLLVSGKLDPTPGGLPDAVSVSRDGLVSAYPHEGGTWRRSIYLQYRRTEIPTMMDTFDYPNMGPNCVARTVSTVSPQSLMLMNNRHVRQLAAAFAARVDDLLNDESDHAGPAARVELVYRLALSRPPSDEERQLGIETLKELESAWQGNFAKAKALETYCHTILNSASFLYID